MRLSFTVTSQVSVVSRETVPAAALLKEIRMVAVPSPTAVSLPFSSTVTTLSLELSHTTTSLPVALERICLVSPVYKRTFSSLMERESLITVTSQVADTPFAVAVMMAVPVFLPVTLPPLTVATVLSEVIHFTDLPVPTMVGVSLMALPFPLVPSCMVSISREMLFFNTFTTQVSVLPFAVAIITA